MGEIRTELARAAGVPSSELDLTGVHERVRALRRRRRQRRTIGGACGVVLLVLVAALVIHVRNGGSDHLEVSGGSPDAYASGAWTKVAPSPLSSRSGSAAVWTGKELVLVGGDNSWKCPPTASCPSGGGPADLRDVAAYDPGHNTWRSLAPLPRGVTRVQPISLDGFIYVLGVAGTNPYSGPANFARYDPRTNEWSVLPRPGRGAGAWGFTTLGHRLVAYQMNLTRSTDLDRVYDPRSNRWADLPRDPFGTNRQGVFSRQLTGIGTELVLIAVTANPVKLGTNDGFTGRYTYRAATFDGTTWRRLGTAPAASLTNARTWLPAQGRLILPGSPASMEFDPTTGTFSSLPSSGAGAKWPEGTPDVSSGRYVATAALEPLLVGDVTTNEWHELRSPVSTKWFGSTVSFAGNRLFVWGGFSFAGPTTTRAVFSGEGWIWSPSEKPAATDPPATAAPPRSTPTLSSPPTDGPRPCGGHVEPAASLGLELTLSLDGPPTRTKYGTGTTKAVVTLRNNSDHTVVVDGHEFGSVAALTRSGLMASPWPATTTMEFLQSTIAPGKSMTVPALLRALACTPGGSTYLPAGRYRVAPVALVFPPGSSRSTEVVGDPAMVTIGRG
jgi:hypothetical protein